MLVLVSFFFRLFQIFSPGHGPSAPRIANLYQSLRVYFGFYFSYIDKKNVNCGDGERNYNEILLDSELKCVLRVCFLFHIDVD